MQLPRYRHERTKFIDLIACHFLVALFDVDLLFISNERVHVSMFLSITLHSWWWWWSLWRLKLHSLTLSFISSSFLFLVFSYTHKWGINLFTTVNGGKDIMNKCWHTYSYVHKFIYIYLCLRYYTTSSVGSKYIGGTPGRCGLFRLLVAIIFVFCKSRYRFFLLSGRCE